MIFLNKIEKTWSELLEVQGISAQIYSIWLTTVIIFHPDSLCIRPNRLLNDTRITLGVLHDQTEFVASRLVELLELDNVLMCEEAMQLRLSQSILSIFLAQMADIDSLHHIQSLILV